MRRGSIADPCSASEIAWHAAAHATRAEPTPFLLVCTSASSALSSDIESGASSPAGLDGPPLRMRAMRLRRRGAARLVRTVLGAEALCRGCWPAGSRRGERMAASACSWSASSAAVGAAAADDGAVVLCGQGDNKVASPGRAARAAVPAVVTAASMRAIAALR